MEAGRGIGNMILKVGMWIVISLLLAVVYYFLFSSFFNTPGEGELIRERESLAEQYDILKGEMETLELVIDNLEEWDREIYHTLFKSDPPDVRNELSRVNRATTSTDLVFQTDTIYKRLCRQADKINGLFRAIAASITPEKVGAIPDVIPLRDLDIHRVGATVGEKIHPYYRTIRMHTGLDIIVILGTDVLAPANGVVAEVARSTRESGNTITIEHAFGYRTVYAHLSEIFVRKGQEVTKGTLIARAGDSGRSLAPHLHYEIWKGEELMNPIHFGYAQLNPEMYTQLMIAGYNSGQSLD